MMRCETTPKNHRNTHPNENADIEEAFYGQVFHWVAAGCSGDCAGDYLSPHALNNRARNFGIPAASGFACNPDPFNCNLNRLDKGE